MWQAINHLGLLIEWWLKMPAIELKGIETWFKGSHFSTHICCKYQSGTLSRDIGCLMWWAVVSTWNMRTGYDPVGCIRNDLCFFLCLLLSHISLDISIFRHHTRIHFSHALRAPNVLVQNAHLLTKICYDYLYYTARTHGNPIWKSFNCLGNRLFWDIIDCFLTALWLRSTADRLKFNCLCFGFSYENYRKIFSQKLSHGM